jgi:aminoglycoside phosphotransferase (APT) family kinase protein
MKELNAAGVEEILARRFPELAPVRAAYLGAGMDSVAFEVDGKWVFRFPLRQDVERQLFVERAILPVLAPLLPLAIPRFAFAGVPGEDCPMHFAGYEKLPGVSATEVPASSMNFPGVARQLGQFLTVLHRFPVGEAERLGVRTQRAEDDFEAVRAGALADLAATTAYVGAASVGRVRRYLERAQPVAAPPWPLVLTHYDLAAEHVLLDVNDGKATGVIDWGDVSIGDPTVDFFGLFTWGGDSLVRAVLDNYDGIADERLLDRVRPWGMFRAVQDIRFGVDRGLSAVIEMAVQALEREL